MKAALFIIAILLVLIGIRCINVLNDIVAAVTVGGLAILCFYTALIYDSLGANKEMD